MNALEFSGKIEHGMIRLPKRYEEYENSYVRIIVLIEEPDNFLKKKKNCGMLWKK